MDLSPMEWLVWVILAWLVFGTEPLATLAARVEARHTRRRHGFAERRLDLWIRPFALACVTGAVAGALVAGLLSLDSPVPRAVTSDRSATSLPEAHLTPSSPAPLCRPNVR